MSDGNFSEFIARERERLSNEREQLFNQQQEIQQKLDAINKEFAAITAYEAAKTGKQARGAGSSGGRQQTRARRGSKREELMKLIGENSGMKRAELLERMGIKGDKAGEMSVSNALTALTKSNQVRRDGGKYFAA